MDLPRGTAVPLEPPAFPGEVINYVLRSTTQNITETFIQKRKVLKET